MEVTNVTHVPWKTRLIQSSVLVVLLAGIALLARAPGWINHTVEPAQWRPPRIEVLNEAHELTLEVAVVPKGEAALKTQPGEDIGLKSEDILDVSMRNRSGQSVYVAVLTLDVANTVRWLVPDASTSQHAATPPTDADNSALQALAHWSVQERIPAGHLDIVGMFFSEPVQTYQIVAALHDGGINALRNMQHVIAMDTVSASVRPSNTPDAGETR